MTIGRVNPAHRLEDQGIIGLGTVYYNQIEPALVEAAVQRGEGRLGKGGAFLVSTGARTGRSPKDKFVVRTPAVEDSIWWENNAPMTPEAFDLLHADMLAHMKGGDYFVQDLYAGADPELRLDVRVVTELAWHGLFIRHLLRRPAAEELAGFVPEFTIINCPTFKADPARHGCRSDTDHRAQLRQEADPDRQHRLCRREQEVGLHPAELHPAGQGRDGDALLCQPRHRQSRRHRRFLRPVGHRQDHAVGRPLAHADRR